MGFFDRVKEALRDKTSDHIRGHICAGLQKIGVDAQMAKQGYLRRDMVRYFGGRSLGVVEIRQGPINWVHVAQFTENRQAGNIYWYYTDYGVPDTRLGPNSPEPRIKSVRIKSFPLIGNVIDLRWKGKDFGLGIIERLNNDVVIKQPIMRSPGVVLRALRDHNCWLIAVKACDPPSPELWNCYQAIARHLLAEWTRS